MKHQITTLPNGLRIVTQEMRESYSASVSVVVGVGSRYEDATTEAGISHFLEHLMFKGTKQRPSTKVISEQVDAVGGYANAYTSNELTDYYIKVPYQHVELAVDVLSDMLRNSKLDAKEIDRERGVVLEEMNVYRDNPSSYVHNLPPELLWPGHAIARDVIGTEEVIKKVNRATINSYWQRYYRPSNMVLAVAGRVKHAAVVKLAERYLGDMVDAEIPTPDPVTKLLSKQTTKALIKDTAQTHLIIAAPGYQALHPNGAAAKLLATILGHGLSSRLFLNVRERKGLAYSVNANHSSFTDTGEFQVYAGVNLAKTVDAIAAIIEELQLIVTKPVGVSELSKAKNQIRGALQMSQESNSSVADRLGYQLLLQGKIRTLKAVMAEIDAVTPKQIQAVAAEMLDPSRLRLAIISPAPKKAVTAFNRLVQ